MLKAYNKAHVLHILKNVYTKMATIQAKITNGHKYWYIVESRRINGKPRPVVLAYLGKAEVLLNRLQGFSEAITLKSYTHGAVAALLCIANRLDICQIINKHIFCNRSYVAKQPLRNQLTAGASYLLAAIGRVCMPTSKQGWQEWAKTTSLEYLLKMNINKLDSQHFWDHMDALPIEAIEQVEQALLQRVLETYQLETDSLFFDTTNFFTYIDSTNTDCTIAKRGRNKQKRNDLRQIGLALVVTRKDFLPLFHLPYEGNLHDSKVFPILLDKLKSRLSNLKLPISNHTLIFDRGNNSKVNLKKVSELGFYYVGALTPYQHQSIIQEAETQFSSEEFAGKKLSVYRIGKEIWDEERTVVVYISEKLKEGQLRGIYQSVEKAKKALTTLQQSLQNTKAKKRDREALEKKVQHLTQGQFMQGLFKWEFEEVEQGKFNLSFSIDKDELEKKEDLLGFRIIMTNRHDWSNAEIINAYHGQATVEKAFKEIKNPYHMAVRPQFHWTDQKIRVHYFICILGYLLMMLLWREVKQTLSVSYSSGRLIDNLINIRLGSMLELAKKPGKMKASYKLEKTSDEELRLIEALGISEIHNKRLKLLGFGVYI